MAPSVCQRSGQISPPKLGIKTLGDAYQCPVSGGRVRPSGASSPGWEEVGAELDQAAPLLVGQQRVVGTQAGGVGAVEQRRSSPRPSMAVATAARTRSRGPLAQPGSNWSIVSHHTRRVHPDLGTVAEHREQRLELRTGRPGGSGRVGAPGRRHQFAGPLQVGDDEQAGRLVEATVIAPIGHHLAHLVEHGADRPAPGHPHRSAGPAAPTRRRRSRSPDRRGRAPRSRARRRGRSPPVATAACSRPGPTASPLGDRPPGWRPPGGAAHLHRRPERGRLPQPHPHRRGGWSAALGVARPAGQRRRGQLGPVVAADDLRAAGRTPLVGQAAQVAQVRPPRSWASIHIVRMGRSVLPASVTTAVAGLGRLVVVGAEANQRGHPAGGTWASTWATPCGSAGSVRSASTRCTPTAGPSSAQPAQSPSAGGGHRVVGRRTARATRRSRRTTRPSCSPVRAR